MPARPRDRPRPPRVGQHRLRLAVGDDLARIHADQPLGHLQQHVHDVLDPDDRRCRAAAARGWSRPARSLRHRSARRRSRRAAAATGRVASARASSSRLRSSRPSVSAGRLASFSMPHSVSASTRDVIGLGRATGRRPGSPRHRHSRTPSCPRTAAGSGACAPGPGGSARRRTSAVTSAPLKLMLPALGGCAPDSTESSVVLPAPLGPTMPSASPRADVEVDAVEHHKRSEALVEPVGHEDRRVGLHGRNLSQLAAVSCCTAAAWRRSARSGRGRCRRSPDRTGYLLPALATSPTARR